MSNRVRIQFADLLARYGADLAKVYSHIDDVNEADRLIDEFCAGVKEGADLMRAARFEREATVAKAKAAN